MNRLKEFLLTSHNAAWAVALLIAALLAVVAWSLGLFG